MYNLENVVKKRICVTSANSRKKNWGKGAIDAISEQLRKELPGLRGFSATSMRNMRTFYEEWRQLENNSSVATDGIQVLPPKSSVATDEITKINTSGNSAVVTADFTDDAEIRQLQLANLTNFPLREFLSISFTHHIAILTKAKTYEERVFYMKYADGYKPTVEDLEKVIKQDWKDRTMGHSPQPLRVEFFYVFFNQHRELLVTPNSPLLTQPR